MREGVEDWKRDVFFLVEANSFEHQTLWHDNSIEGLEYDCRRDGRPYRLSEHPHRVAWEQLNPSYWMQIGTVNKRPVCVCL